MSSKEYDLKKSEDKIGQLYPVLLSKDGKVIDGFHRLESDKKWRTEILEHIDDDEKLLVARCVSNWHRRPISSEEKVQWINDLARLYQDEGYKIRGASRGGTPPNEIVNKIAQETGLANNTINKYLLDEFKQTERKSVKENKYVIPASQRIENELGKDYVERHREEVREEILDDVKDEALGRAKEELSQDIDFITEIIEKAPELVPNLPEKTIERAKKVLKPKKEMGVKEGTIYIVGEYECPQCKKHYLIKCNGKKDWVE